MSQESVEIVRRAYEAFNRWGVHPGGARSTEVPPLLHPEVQFHTYANVPEPGVYRGRDAMMEYHERVFGQFERVRIELQELLPAGDSVVLVTRQHTVPKGSAQEIVQHVVDVWTIRDGLLAVRKPFATRAEALEALGLSEQNAHADS
jgi:ketosteroid isomerase-like protein